MEISRNPQEELSVLCYRMAYFVVPNLLFSQPERTIGYFADNELPEGPFLYMMATQMLKVEPSRENALLFQAYSGELSATTNYHILEYPTLPPFELGKKGSVLAPFFSAIIQNTSDLGISYFVLGQNPMSGTTFRCVTPDGANANLGPGPLPGLADFLEFLKPKF